jgi:Protein of unknown function DUF88.
MISRVIAFVDWDTARRVTLYRSLACSFEINEVVEILSNEIARHLQTIYKKGKYRVNWRVYHGWHKGKSKTKDRIEFEKFAISAVSQIVSHVSFSNTFEYGDSMLCETRRGVLYGTLRSREDGKDEQKMVDTALVCDVLLAVRFKEADIFIVVADDKDLLPAIFTAESWGAKATLLTQRDNINKYIDLGGLVYKMGLI